MPCQVVKVVEKGGAAKLEVFLGRPSEETEPAVYLAERILHHVRSPHLTRRSSLSFSVGNDEQIDAKPLEQAPKRVEVHRRGAALKSSRKPQTGMPINIAPVPSEFMPQPHMDGVVSLTESNNLNNGGGEIERFFKNTAFAFEREPRQVVWKRHGRPGTNLDARNAVPGSFFAPRLPLTCNDTHR